MNDMTPVLANTPSLIPESAPFSGEQRAWLNGFFSGFIALERAAVNGVAGIPSLAPEGAIPAEADDDDAPWHDQNSADGGSDEACGKPAIEAPHDGRDGSAGLRPMRLQL